MTFIEIQPISDTLIKQISLRVPGAKLIPGETLLFLDEIQSCPRARAALKFLTQDGRFDVIASGSLLGINYKDVPSYPVGYVEHLEMHSLDFEEFLWANGVTPGSAADIREYFDTRNPVPSAMRERMMDLLREYIVVGGMPRADIFSKSGKKLYYFEQNGKLEIDFFIRMNKTATAIEVKSADNTKSKSMDAVISKYGVKYGIKLSSKNVGVTETVDSLPLYMAMFL